MEKESADPIINCFVADQKNLDLSKQDISSKNIVKKIIFCLKNETLNHDRDCFNFELSRLTLEGWDMLATQLIAEKCPFALRLGWNSLGHEVIGPLGRIIREHAMLDAVCLAGNDIGDNGLLELGASLKFPHNIHSLSLQHNQLGPTGFVSFISNLHSYAPLKSLNLSYNSLGDDSMEALSNGLLHPASSLEYLDLTLNGITHVGAERLALGLSSPRLKYLNLSCNIIGDDGVYAISAALRDGSTVETLHISNCHISAEGCRYLCVALTKHASMKELYLSRSQGKQPCIGNEGAEEIGRMLRSNTSLTKLDIYWQCIDTPGAEAISQALEINTALRYLNIAGNYVGPEGMNHFREVLRRNLRRANSLRWSDICTVGRAPLLPLRFFTGDENVAQAITEPKQSQRNKPRIITKKKSLSRVAIDEMLNIGLANVDPNSLLS